jgi:hypothetical protein
MSDGSGDSEGGNAHPPDAGPDRAIPGRVQCPNCCRMAPVTSRSMGLLFFQCELCETTGATPDPDDKS